MIALPESSAVLRLGRITKSGGLILCEAMILRDGRAAIETILRRARLAGRVEVGGEIADHLADVLDADGDMVETIALDRKSYSAIKNRWMRCRVEAS